VSALKWIGSSVAVTACVAALIWIASLEGVQTKSGPNQTEPRRLQNDRSLFIIAGKDFDAVLALAEMGQNKNDLPFKQVDKEHRIVHIAKQTPIEVIVDKLGERGTLPSVKCGCSMAHTKARCSSFSQGSLLQVPAECGIVSPADPQ
jgi:hypothetical protein